MAPRNKRDNRDLVPLRINIPRRVQIEINLILEAGIAAGRGISQTDVVRDLLVDGLAFRGIVPKPPPPLVTEEKPQSLSLNELERR